MVPRCERGRSTTPPAGSPRQHPARPPRRRALTPGRAGTRARARGSSRSRRAAGTVPSPGRAGRRSAVARHSRGAGRARQARPELQQRHVVLGVERFQGGLGLCFGYMAVAVPTQRTVHLGRLSGGNAGQRPTLAALTLKRAAAARRVKSSSCQRPASGGADPARVPATSPPGSYPTETMGRSSAGSRFPCRFNQEGHAPTLPSVEPATSFAESWR